MAEALAWALSGPAWLGVSGAALAWLAGVALFAGLVRGFAGFGTALIYMPLAAMVLGPLAALVSLTTMDLIGPIPGAIRAAPMAERRDVGRLALGLVLGVPLGLALLGQLPVEAFRYLVSGLSLAVVVLLASGFRYRGRLGGGAVFGTGAAGGFLGGLAGLPGPPAILLYMASDRPAQVVRANLLLYLVAVDLTMMAVLALSGRLEGAHLALGLVLAAPYLVGNLLGAVAFRPGRERTYRAVAYALIAAAAIVGLPLWQG